MKRLQKCCCCANTRDGSIIVAVLGILLSIATIVFIWVAPSRLVSFSSYFFEEKDKQYNSKYKDMLGISVQNALMLYAKLRRNSFYGGDFFI